MNGNANRKNVVKAKIMKSFFFILLLLIYIGNLNKSEYTLFPPHNADSYRNIEKYLSLLIALTLLKARSYEKFILDEPGIRNW